MVAMAGVRALTSTLAISGAGPGALRAICPPPRQPPRSPGPAARARRPRGCCGRDVGREGER